MEAYKSQCKICGKIKPIIDNGCCKYCYDFMYNIIYPREIHNNNWYIEIMQLQYEGAILE